MGIGTLRRYHPTIDPERAKAAKEDAADPTQDTDPQTVDHLARIEAATKELDAAREASTKAQEAANAAPDDIDAAEAASKAEQAAQDAQQALEDVQREWEAEQARQAAKHGDLDQPARGASTADWAAYDDANPEGPQVQREPAKGLRDRIAEFYLGPKA